MKNFYSVALERSASVGDRDDADITGRLNTSHEMTNKLRQKRRNLAASCSGHGRRWIPTGRSFLFGLLALPIASSQLNPPAAGCISLATSTMCPAFSSSQISAKITSKL